MNRLLLTTALVLLAAPARAGGPPPLVQVVPYSGQLDLDGAPYTGSVQIRFRLYTDGAQGDPAAACAGVCAWEETHEAVQVYNGSFAVRLGQTVPIAQVVADNAQFWLEMALRAVPQQGGEPGDWVTLANRHQITPVPQAIWAASASDLQLDSLRVAGVTDVRGDLQNNNGAVDTNGGVTVDDPQGLYVRQGGIYANGNVRLNGNIDNPTGAPLVLADAQGVRVSTGPMAVTGDVTATRDVRADSRVITPRVTVNGREFYGMTYTNVFNVDLNYANEPGRNEREIGLVPDDGRSVCFLTGMLNAGADGLPADYAQCYIAPEGGNWIMRGYRYGNNNRTFCRARCIRWGQ